MGIFPSQPEQEAEEVRVEEDLPLFDKSLNQMIVMLYSYVGTGFHGLQYNHDNPTIEQFLFDAMARAGLIPRDAHVHLGRLKWREASRTDVGVHAAAQILSLRISLPRGSRVHDVAQLVMSHMAADSPVAIWQTIAAPSNGFNAQEFAEARRYQYLMPLHVFSETSARHLQMIRDTILPLFVGTKNYHNYTKRVLPNAKSAIRVIVDFDLSAPFDLDGEKYVLWTIHGKSFMMNQIRKMLSAVLCASYGLISPEDLARTFTEERWALSILPGDGLFLDKVEYPAQRRRHGSSPGKDVEFEACRPLVERWKRDVLFPSIKRHVQKTDLFRQWIKDVMTQFPPVPQDSEQAESKGKRKSKNIANSNETII